jgi:hypothetical protein
VKWEERIRATDDELLGSKLDDPDGALRTRRLHAYPLLIAHRWDTIAESVSKGCTLITQNCC